jgi:hypothetical protein
MSSISTIHFNSDGTIHRTLRIPTLGNQFSDEKTTSMWIAHYTKRDPRDTLVIEVDESWKV